VRAGEEVDLTVKKPGFAPELKHLAASEETRAVDVVLTQINGFEGTWVLPDGQLRAFTRSGDEHVDVFKLSTLASEKEFYRKFLLEDSPTGVKFAATDTIVDQRAPTEPSCQVPVRVEYFYDPQKDMLEVRPEDVETGFQQGRCVVHNRELVAAVPLVRAQADADTRTTRAPVGKPIDAPSLRQRPDPNDPNDPNDDKNVKERLQKDDLQNLRKPTQKPPPSKAPLTKGKKTSSLDNANLDKAPPKQQANVPAKLVKPEPPPSAQNTPTGGEQQQQVRGDSQIAPQVKK